MDAPSFKSLFPTQALIAQRTARQRVADELRDETLDLATLFATNPLLDDLQLTGVESETEKRVAAALHILKRTGYQSLQELLPLLLRLKGRPYKLTDHFPFQPMFRLRMPDSILWMTGRQVSKSSSLAAQGVISSTCLPHFSTLYLTPLFEQIRRFSQNYVRPFIDTSPVARMMTGVSTVSNVLERSFRNHSRMTFSFAYLDAERTRGIPADRISLDESVRSGTMISVPGGCRPVEEMRPGDLLDAFDEHGRQTIDEVVARSDHGVRDCYRIELDDGSFVDATSDSFVATTVGWRRVSTLIRELHVATDPDAPGHDAGRRVDVHDENSERKSQLHQPARLDSASLQPGEVPGLVRVRRYAAQEAEERGLRRMVEHLAHAELSRAAPYRVLVSPRRPEARDVDLARTTELGRDRLVVSGRRRLAGRHVGRLQHSLLFATGSRTVGFLADAERHRSLGVAGSSPSRRLAVVDREALCGSDLRVGRADPPVRDSGDAVQAGVAGAPARGRLRLVPPGVSPVRQPDEVQAANDATLLRRRRMSAETARGEQREVDGEAGETNRQESTGARAVRSESGKRTGTVSRQGSSPAAGEARSRQSREETLPGKEAAGTSGVVVDLSTLRLHGTLRKSRSENEVLRRLPTARDDGTETRQRCETAAIVAVRWVGRHRVFDLQTRRHRTFFAGGVAVHNCQDMDISFLPVLFETLSASPWKLKQFAGTPKTLDNTIHKLWESTSQAEWFTKCAACNHWNIPSLDHDLLGMLGPWSNDIGPHRPGTVCAKCQQPLDPRTGRWYHRYPERRWEFAGYHVPQIILPMHYADKKAWSLLLAKREGRGGVPLHTFFNEVCGQSYDSGSRLVTLTDLQKAACLPWKCNVDEAEKNLNRYVRRILAVDWGGGGLKIVGKKQTTLSFTVLAVLGLTPTGKLDVIWGYRSQTPHDRIREARLIRGAMSRFRCTHLAHDYTGAGADRETILVQAGFPRERILPLVYAGPAKSGLLLFKPATEQHPRDHWIIDKSRSLQLACQMIKLGQIRFFQDDYQGVDDEGLLRDFLGLMEETTPSRLGRDVYTIYRDPNRSDDFAQAVNIGMLAMYGIVSGEWPDLAQAGGIKLVPQEVAQIRDVHQKDWLD